LRGETYDQIRESSLSTENGWSAYHFPETHST
jgi:hypothetical protein